MTKISKSIKNNFSINWRGLFIVTVNGALFYALMEWVFFVTKPSSLSVLTLYNKVKVLAVTGGVIALVLLAGICIFSIPALLVNNSKWRARLLNLVYVPAVLILSITVLILLDNFTYTLYKFGIVSTEGILRIVYALGFLVVFWQTFRYVKRTTRTYHKSVSFLTFGILVISMIGILADNFFSRSLAGGSFIPSTTSVNRPNIIILGSDGLSAKYMSVYGYEHETTPFLSHLAETSLVAENAFTNASSTTASTTSALTGKEPASVNVLRYPDILSGTDSFEHLPGILKQQGYKTVEYGIPYYIDAQKLNLLDGFDIVNDRNTTPPALNILRDILGNSPSTYFIQTIVERASDRLFHIFILKQMRNPLNEVVSPDSRVPDAQLVDQILSLLDETEQPVFIFAHMMNTHGPFFTYDEQIFSNESNSEKKWDLGHYEDAILSFDNNVQKIYEGLSRSGQLDNTILLIYTDHGFGYAISHRIPIIIHFPKDVHAGKRKSNIQIMDIPMTILDYLEIPAPEWMIGTSMIGGEPPTNREIFSIEASSPRKIAPPFYQIKTLQLVVCHKRYALNVQENEWKSGSISGHTARCDEKLLPSDDEARQKILDYLEKFGYDIGTLLNEKQEELPSTFDIQEFGSL